MNFLSFLTCFLENKIRISYLYTWCENFPYKLLQVSFLFMLLLISVYFTPIFVSIKDNLGDWGFVSIVTAVLK